MLELTTVDYADAQHARDLVHLLNIYASEEGGGGEPLSAFVQQNLAAELGKRADAVSVLAYVDKSAVGLANCFEGFSTFSCRPLLNIHDLMVAPEYRRQGVSQALLSYLESLARDRGCCKLTLEVLTENRAAIDAYEKFGFAQYELNPEYGHAVMLQKSIARPT